MNIDYDEVLHYLGYHNNHRPYENTEELITECIIEIKGIAQKQYVYDIFDTEHKNGKILLKQSNVTLYGHDIAHHLKHSSKTALMAVTLGLEVDKRISLYLRINPTKGLILDACASAAVEALCDEVEGKIRLKAASEGLYITSRYSPGYGDLPLCLQGDIAAALDTYRKIGLAVTKDFLLAPRKSVIAIIGVQQVLPDKRGCGNKCKLCSAVNCQYRKGENFFE